MIAIAIYILVQCKDRSENNILNVAIGRYLGLIYIMIAQYMSGIFAINTNSILELVIMLPGVLIIIGTFFLRKINK